MGFLKRNWFMLLCSVFGVAGLALMVVFSGCMVEITADMEESSKLFNELGTIQIANQRTIEAVASTTVLARERYNEVVKSAISTNRREPLRQDVFPRMAEAGAQFRFQTDYRKVFDELMRQLNPKADQTKISNFDMPNQEEIDKWEAELQRRYEEENALTGDPNAADAPGRVRPPRRPNPGGQFPGQLGADSTLTPEEAAATDPVKLASIAKARAIYCYVGLESFQRHAVFFATNTFDESAMWAAQMSLWVQQDVVVALAAVNNRAAELLEARNQAAGDQAKQMPIDVSTMPVKHLRSIALSAGAEIYLSSGGAGGAGGGGPGGAGGAGMPPGGPGMESDLTFTEREGNELFDVIPFRVEVVCDQRDLPQIIDEIAKVNFYTPVNVSYDREGVDAGAGTAAPVRGTPEYLYGHEPVVLATLDFEGYFFREAYHYRRPDTPTTQPETENADGEIDAVAAGEDQLENYPFMPESVRELVEQGVGISSLHNGFPTATGQPAAPVARPMRPRRR